MSDVHPCGEMSPLVNGESLRSLPICVWMEVEGVWMGESVVVIAAEMAGA
jgi:hypothetical protein